MREIPFLWQSSFGKSQVAGILAFASLNFKTLKDQRIVFLLPKIYKKYFSKNQSKIFGSMIYSLKYFPIVLKNQIYLSEKINNISEGIFAVLEICN